MKLWFKSGQMTAEAFLERALKAEYELKDAYRELESLRRKIQLQGCQIQNLTIQRDIASEENDKLKSDMEVISDITTKYVDMDKRQQL